MKPRLSKEYVDNALSYDPDTGLFTWKFRADKAKQINTRVAGKQAGTLDQSGYILIGINKVNYAAHRLAWLVMTGEWPASEIDHRDGMGSNNKWENLRLATRAQNNANQKAYGASGLKGVCYHKRDKVWQAGIRIGEKSIHLGSFNTPEEAHAAYCDAAAKKYGEFALHLSRD